MAKEKKEKKEHKKKSKSRSPSPSKSSSRSKSRDSSKSPKSSDKKSKKEKSPKVKKDKKSSPKSSMKEDVKEEINMKIESPNPMFFCDGCHSTTTRPLYSCAECNQILCSSCDSNRHRNTTDSMHHREKLISEADFSNYRIRCQKHPFQYINYYCRACWQPLCNECRLTHGLPGHEPTKIIDAYRSSVSLLHNTCVPSLAQKQQLLRQQIGNIQQRCKEVKGMKQSIQAETQAEYDGIIGRLNYEENLKLSFLQTSISELQKQIDEIDQFIQSSHLSSDCCNNNNNFIYDNQSPYEMLSFLNNYARLSQTAEQIVKRPFNTNINITATFDREVETRKMKLLRINELENEILIKDQMIYKLMNERKEYSKIFVNDELKALAEKSEKEIKEWSEISDRLNIQLEKYKMRCNNCGMVLSPENINSICNNSSDNKHFFEHF